MRTGFALAVLAAALTLAVVPGRAATGPCTVASESQPDWATAKRATVLTDSVLYLAHKDLKRAMPGWTLVRRGYVSLTIPGAEAAIRRSGKPVAPLVVVGLGYNSNWQPRRRNYRFWASRFDRDARNLVRTLRRHGASQIVWVNLRQANRRNTPRVWWGYLIEYAWYFPYVNERLDLLDRRDDGLVVADWRRAGRPGGLTHDAIHLNRRGTRLMARTIDRAVAAEARRQACRANMPSR